MTGADSAPLTLRSKSSLPSPVLDSASSRFSKSPLLALGFASSTAATRVTLIGATTSAHFRAVYGPTRSQRETFTYNQMKGVEAQQSWSASTVLRGELLTRSFNFTSFSKLISFYCCGLAHGDVVSNSASSQKPRHFSQIGQP